MSSQETKDRNSAAITRFVILLVISGVSYLGLSYRKNAIQTPEGEAPTTQIEPANSKVARPQESFPQLPTKTKLGKTKHQTASISSSRELDSAETESYDPQRVRQKITPEAEKAPSDKSIRRPTNAQTTPGGIKDVVIEPRYSTPVQATR